MAKITSRERHLLKKYGITNDQYDEIYRKQQGCCAVCGRHSDTFRIKLAIDHDHHSREIRGLLCNYCNRYVVGRNRRESGAQALLAAYTYLTGEYTGWVVPPKQKRRKKRRSTRRGTRVTAMASSVAPQ